jgi:threonine dehydratase
MHITLAEGTARVTLEEVRDAASALDGVVLRTPLIEAPALWAAAGVPVRLKCEHLQSIGAFKIRGAYNALRQTPESERRRGVITHSSGNHGLAVAYAARLLGTSVIVVMPRGAPAVKIEGVRRYGGEIVFVETPAEREAKTAELADALGLVVIPPYEHPAVIAGQATCGLEIVEQWPEVATILVPVGGGGLIAGIATAAAALRPGIRIIGVEPAAVPKLSAALRAGRPTAVPRAQSLADGLLPPAVGRLPFEHLREVVHEAVAVSDDEIIAAVRLLSREHGLRIEPSGAAAVAAVLSGRLIYTGPAVAVLSGGNVDADLFFRLVR